MSNFFIDIIDKTKVTFLAENSCPSWEASIFTQTSDIITTIACADTFLSAVFSKESAVASCQND